MDDAWGGYSLVYLSRGRVGIRVVNTSVSFAFRCATVIVAVIIKPGLEET